MGRVLDELCFFSVVKDEVLKFSLLLTVEQVLGNSRIGEGVSWWGGSGEAERGDPRGVRRGEQVKPKVGSDLSAAVRVKNKRRCSHSWLQMLDREEKVNIYMLFYISIYITILESNRVIFVKPLIKVVIRKIHSEQTNINMFDKHEHFVLR